MRKIKEYFKAFIISLGVSIIAGLFARFAVFPITAMLNNRWYSIVSSDTVNLVYFWIGQIVGSMVLVGYMYLKLREYKWSKPGTIISIISSILVLALIGLLIAAILSAITNR